MFLGFGKNLKAIATAADPSEGKNWSKFEKKNRFFKFELKIFGIFLKKS